MDAHGVPVRVIITDDAAADCGQAEKVMDWIDAGVLLAIPWAREKKRLKVAAKLEAALTFPGGAFIYRVTH